MCFSSNAINDAILLKVTHTKKVIFSEDRLSKLFYWMVVNNGIPLKVKYTIKFYPTKTKS